VPQGIVEVPINAITGSVVADGTPGSIIEAFKAGTEPGAGYAVSDINDVPGAAATASADDVPQTGATPAAVSNTGRANTIGTGTGGLY
jgi:penicillin-binding protein 1A